MKTRIQEVMNERANMNNASLEKQETSYVARFDEVTRWKAKPSYRTRPRNMSPGKISL